MQPASSLPHSQEHSTWPYPINPSLKPCKMLRNIVSFYGEELLAPLSTPNLEDHPLSAVRDCISNLFVVTLHICRPFLFTQHEDAPCCDDWDPFNTFYFYVAKIIYNEFLCGSVT